jgi:hypothetical protein
LEFQTDSLVLPITSIAIMVNLSRLVLPFLSVGLPSQEPLYTENGALPAPAKSVAIIGAGSAGLAMLKTVLDLPSHNRAGWEIVLYEERENVSGVWQACFLVLFPVQQ